MLRRHPIINALTARVPVAALEGLSRNPFVLSISTDAVVIAEQTSSGDSLRGTLGISGGNHTGYRVGVAVIDSGLEAGPEFGDRIAGFYDFTRGGSLRRPQTITATAPTWRADRGQWGSVVRKALPGSCTEGAAHCAQGSG